jgi:glycosyltransferase involved in cell wall biosynthesis
MFTTNLAAFRKRFSKNPLIITNHGFRVKRGASMGVSQSIYLSTLGRWTLRAADYVVSLTENDRRKTISAGVPSGKAIVIPNGVDTQLFRPQTSEQIPHSIVWMGRYAPEKGLERLLKAARLLAAEVPDSKFLLVGSGEERGRLVALARQLKLEDNVLFVDPMSPKGIAALLNKCTLFALPSLSEGFPTALLEAMSCAIPVVAASGIGLEEVVGDAGIFAHASNSRELAIAIRTILTDTKLGKSLGLRGRKRVMKYYDWRKVVSAVNGLYKKAIEEKRA